MKGAGTGWLEKYVKHKKNQPRSWGRFRKGLQIPMTYGLTRWWAEEMTKVLAAGPMFIEYVLRCKKRNLKNPGKFSKIRQTVFEKDRSPMEKGRIEFSLWFHQPGWNSEQNGIVKIFFYINSNCVFSKISPVKASEPASL